MDATERATMIKSELHRCLQGARSSVLSKLDGLGEHSLRRPMTPTGTNLLGVVKHLGMLEYGYLGQVFGRQHMFAIRRVWPPTDDPFRRG
ncbi:hypothetical protein GCM10023317_44110 [Actinopolymorpha pittospori]|uniref:DUF664 domain-containing protein n=2 Tax=Actinopolymorpha pittospori TaxID=648752 RepID=A0A927N9D0_9ACTN|nr:hypothetical protein [Actinopolymorpha pittospori]